MLKNQKSRELTLYKSKIFLNAKKGFLRFSILCEIKQHKMKGLNQSKCI